MFGSVKVKNIRLTVFSLVCLVIFTAVCVLMLRAGAPDTVTIGGESYSLRAEDEADMRAFLTACGVEAGEALDERGVTVPKHWNEAYRDYQELQKAQGLDLVPYKGKAARQLTFDGGERVIVLLRADDRIIAAHICDEDGSSMRRLIINE